MGVLNPIDLWSRQEADEACPSPIPCPPEKPPCTCKAGQTCIQVQRSCNTCPSIRCVGPSGSGGVNPGVIAGPIVGAVIVAASLCLFWWLRRKKKRDLARLEDLADRARKGESSAFHLSQPGSPVTSRHPSTQLGARSPTTSNGSRSSSQRLPNAPVEAEYRDANGNTIRVYAGKRGAINADPNHPDNGGSGDPFGDHASLSTDRAESGHSTNVIPIQYVPGQDAAVTRSGLPANTSQQAAAARTLDQARQNLWRPRAVPPPRPARAPDLDLRLNSLQQAEHNQLMMMAEGGSSRDSFRSGVSVTPSFLSGATADLHLDVPKIMTRQAVQVGRLQAAEMVQFGMPQPVSFGAQPAVSEETMSLTGSDPFTEHSAELLNTTNGGTFGTSSPHAGGVAAQSTTSLGSRAFDDEGNVSQPSPTDLRFSMGSLAYDRASVSTQGTNHRAQFLSPQDQPPVPSIPAGYDRQRFQSMSSYKSTGNDSLLGSFPMIPPASGGANASNTDLHSAQPGAAPPPTAFKATSPGAGAGAAPGGRPLTATSAHSLADSFLGRFPFVPPNVDADGSSRASEQAHPSRLTLGMSNVSGLGGFEFSFDRSGSAAGGQSADEPPPMPTGPLRSTQASSSAQAAAPAASPASPPTAPRQ